MPDKTVSVRNNPVSRRRALSSPGRRRTQAMIQRAFSAYLETDGITAEQPTSKSSIETVGNLQYVVLRGERRVLAVYRIRNRLVTTFAPQGDV